MKNVSHLKSISRGPSRPRAADIQLLAIDLDGTLLDDRKLIGKQTVAALRELPRRGVQVVIASARPPRSVRHIYAELKLQTLQINYNGALIWDEPGRRQVHHQPMRGELVRQIIQHARKMHPEVLVTCELLDRCYTDRADSSHTTETGKLFAPDVVAPLESFLNVSMTKVLLLGEREPLKAIETSLGMAFDNDVTIVRTDDDLIQIMDKRVDKSAALKIVARHYGVSPRQIMAIGDAPNDLGMLSMAGIAVAMDNAHPAVKKLAHWTAPSNNDHGVHAALKRFGLCD
ncbi:MAG TPA: Cof-type HAD-IIB family hydrolase [Tepidisphaeraceae bacterium]|nr:Cof-type HAD-IIB family hydrolase [Tepidisphaeraceae bacterium]